MIAFVAGLLLLAEETLIPPAPRDELVLVALTLIGLPLTSVADRVRRNIRITYRSPNDIDSND